MMVEKPKRDEWQTLVIALPLLLAIVGVLMYAEMTRPPVEDVVEQASTPKVTQEEGEDVSYLGSGASGDSWWDGTDLGTYGTAFPFPSGTPSVSYFDTVVDPIPTSPDPAISLGLEGPARLYDAYIRLDGGDKPITGHANLRTVAVSGGGKVGMCVYDASDYSVVAQSDVWTFTTAEGWHEFTFAGAPALVGGKTYIIAILMDFPTVVDTLDIRLSTDFERYIPPPPPGPGGAVLPLIKTESDMAEGTLIN